MAVDKLVDSAVLDAALGAIADVIRTKTGISGSFDFPSPNDLADAIDFYLMMPTGTKSITENGTNIDVAQYSKVDVNVSGGGYTLEDVGSGNISGAIVYTGEYLRSQQFMETAITSFTGDSVNKFSNSAVGQERACFRECNSLTSVSMAIYNIYSNARGMFQDCRALTSVSMPSLQRVADSTFKGCTALQALKLQAANYLEAYVFKNCTNLKAVDFTATINISGGKTFEGCSSLDTLILRSTSRCSLGAVNNFDGTKFASGSTGGTIYIPKSLYDHLGDGTSSDYKAGTNWSTLDGYGTVTWAKIEGSQYENYYADGTPIS